MKSRSFLNFDSMITPVIIKILFYIGIAAAIIGGVVVFFAASSPPSNRTVLAQRLAESLAVQCWLLWACCWQGSTLSC